MREPIRFLDILKILARERVELVIVGGVAGVLGGAPISTFDLDIVFREGDENRERLLRALIELDASYLDPGERRIVPDAEKLATMKLHRLRTRYGVLDAMTEIGSDWTYSELLDRSYTLSFDGLDFRVLDLSALIEAKKIAGREKDKAILPLLRRTLELGRDER